MSTYSEDLQRAYMFARNWAKARGAQELTSEHLLLGMLLDAQGPAKEMLKNSGIDIADLWTAVEERLPASDGDKAETLSEDAKLKQLVSNAGKNNQEVSQLDLLLAFIKDGEGPGRVLYQHGLRAGHIEKELEVFEATETNQSPKETDANLLEQELSISFSRLREVQPLRQIHPVFIGIMTIIIGSAVLTHLELIPNYLGTFLFVFFGWIASVSLHEYGHAIVAYMLGDDSIIDKGYLTLNPILYAHSVLSVVLPLVFLLMGGIGLPGGAVYVNHLALRDYRYSSLVSAAGPAMTLFALLLCLIPFWLFYPRETFFLVTSGAWPALGLLGFLNIMALGINLLPIPGIDGFGILAPWLPESVQRGLLPFRSFGFLILILLLRIPTFGSIFFGILFLFGSLLGLDRDLFSVGFDLFQFWM